LRSLGVALRLPFLAFLTTHSYDAHSQQQQTEDQGFSHRLSSSEEKRKPPAGISTPVTTGGEYLIDRRQIEHTITE
jgi:hypothetical protein